MPNALDNQLTIRPGFPDAWNEAALTIPDVTFAFQRKKAMVVTSDKAVVSEKTVTSDSQIRRKDAPAVVSDSQNPTHRHLRHQPYIRQTNAVAFTR